MVKEHIKNMNIKEHEKTFSIYEGWWIYYPNKFEKQLSF
jgi:phage pi2 protein 07